jgi:hypothetical protein
VEGDTQSGLAGASLSWDDEALGTQRQIHSLAGSTPARRFGLDNNAPQGQKVRWKMRTTPTRMTDSDHFFALLGILILLAVGGALFIGIPIVKLSGGAMPNYSEGSRVGQVLKISNKGIIWKSWEGELLMSNAAIGNSDGGMVRDVWEFSVRDEAVAREIERAAEEGRRIQLHYTQHLIRPIQLSTSYTVVRVSSPADK